MACLSPCLFSLEISGYTKVIFTLSSVCFQTWCFWSVPLRVNLTPFPSTPSPRQGQVIGVEQGKIPVTSSPYQPVCLDTVGFRNAPCSRRSVFLLRDRTEMTPSQGSNSACWGGSAAHFWMSPFDRAPFLSSFFLSPAASISALSSAENIWGAWGMAASPTCIPDRLFSYALWLVEGAMISGKRTREAWWTAGVPLGREKSQSSVANSPSN